MEWFRSGTMFVKVTGFLGAVLACTTMMAAAQVVGPLVGQVGSTDARFLYRTDGVAKQLRLTVTDSSGRMVGTATTSTDATADHTAHFHVRDLTPSTKYNYQIEEADASGTSTLLAGGDGQHHFQTFPDTGEPGECTAAFVSNANDKSMPVWSNIATLDVDALFLMGDTPSIDQSELSLVRKKHRDFLLSLGLNSLIRRIPTIGTWDDHDFGLNNGNGKNVPGKAANRQGFIEYRANAQYGIGNKGIFSNVPCGPMEVFLLDARWFSQTEPSPVSPDQPTCFGRVQWEWLLKALKQSRSTFKIIAIGGVWQDKKSNENDDMQTYWYERDALLDYIRDQEIPGVVLLGGDATVSRHLIHRQRVGYDLHDLITCPANTNVLPSHDVYHPDLEWSSKSERQFLTLHANTRVQPAVLTAKFHKHDGTVQRVVTIPADKMASKQGSGLAKNLCAYWPLDGDGMNKSVLGTRLDASEVSGAKISPNGGIQGGRGVFDLTKSQYLRVAHNVLPDNCAQYTASLWAKPGSLPSHSSQERSYLIETTPAGEASNAQNGFGVSLGINPGTSADKVNVVLYTHILRPAAPSADGTNSPSPLSQGPFSFPIERSKLLNQWTHFACTFDSKQLQLYINGQPVKAFPLSASGPLSENGGLIIGGHRNGTGRNFNGQLDEIAIWSRALPAKDISSLWNNGSPQPIPTAIDHK